MYAFFWHEGQHILIENKQMSSCFQITKWHLFCACLFVRTSFNLLQEHFVVVSMFPCLVCLGQAVPRRNCILFPPVLLSIQHNECIFHFTWVCPLLQQQTFYSVNPTAVTLFCYRSWIFNHAFKGWVRASCFVMINYT